MGNLRQQLISDDGAWTDQGVARAGAGRVAANDELVESRHVLPITHALEAEVIPRLVLSHRAAINPTSVTLIAANPADVLSLVDIVMRDQSTNAVDFVRSLLARGTTLDEIYLDLLAPTARHLGHLWDEDLCNFTDVTLGLWRLHQVLKELGPTFEQDTPVHAATVRHDQAHRALLLPLPGSQHTFGLLMVADFFRRAGWAVWSEPAATRPDLLRMVRRNWYGLIGFSMACETELDELAGCIRGVRRASRNPNIGVMVGGPIFLEHPEFVALVGADATARDGRQAVLQAQGLLALLANRG